MKYFKIVGGNGYCGCDFEDVVALPEEVANEIEQIAYDMAIENAESYEYIVTGWHNDWESEEDRDSYYDEACANTNYWEISKTEYEEFCNE